MSSAGDPFLCAVVRTCDVIVALSGYAVEPRRELGLPSFE
jgi:hypothetical protein